jgi:hypothetical protein
MSSDISEEHVTSIIRVKEQVNQETSLKQVASRAMRLPKFSII